jgi:hypothetical protein
MTPPHYRDESVTLYAGDALDVLRTLPDQSVDAVVTDPPAGIAFMGKQWDGAKGGREQWSAWLAAIMAEALRVTKPGGHALVWALPRTAHWTACGLEDAGWQVRDRITHLFGSGFPKSLDVGKAIDRAGGDPLAFHRFAHAYAAAVAASPYSHTDIDRHLGIKSSSCYWARDDHRGGMPPRHHWEQVRDLLGLDASFEWLYAEAEREVLETRRDVGGRSVSVVGRPDASDYDVTAPATDAARRWDGWGTALKPAAEDWWLCRKPLEGTVAGNVTRWGTGALNVAACRVEHASPGDLAASQAKNPGRDDLFTSGTYGAGRPQQSVNAAGRWPTNALLDTAAAQQLDRETGNRPGFSTQRFLGGTAGKSEGWGNVGAVPGETREGYNDQGGASRFFPTFPAADPADPGHLPAHRTGGSGGLPAAQSGRGDAGSGEGLRAPLRDPSADADAALRFAPPDPLPAWRYEPKAPTHERPVVDGEAHSTVKPLDLIRWLCRLITPPGGTVLDMFAGSGTTGEACVVEGFRAVLVEREPAYLPLIVARLSKPIQPDLFGGVA